MISSEDTKQLFFLKIAFILFFCIMEENNYMGT